MRYILKATYAPNFQIEWTAPDATKLWAGMPSVNHRGTMPLSAPELATFRRMEVEGKHSVPTDRYLFLLAPKDSAL